VNENKNEQEPDTASALRNSKLFLGPHITVKLIKFYLIEKTLPKSIIFLINKYNIELIFSNPIFSYISHLLKIHEEGDHLENSLLSSLKELKERDGIEISYSINSLNVFRSKFSHTPLAKCILSHLLLSLSHECQIYITSKQHKKVTKKTYHKILKSSLKKGIIEDDEKNNNNSLSGLKINTFQELFDEYIPLRLGDVAYDSSEYDFYISTNENTSHEIDAVVSDSLEEIAEDMYMNDISPTKLLKDLALAKFGKKTPKMKKIYKTLLAEFPSKRNTFARDSPNNSYIYYHQFKNVDNILIHLNKLEKEENQTVVLGADFILILLAFYEENDKTFPKEILSVIKEGNISYTCVPNILSFLSDLGYRDFIKDFLLKVVSIHKIIKALAFSKRYYEQFSPENLPIYDPLELCEEDYWKFYIQYHLSLAQYLGAIVVVLSKELTQIILKRDIEQYPFLFDVNGNYLSNKIKIVKTKVYKKNFEINLKEYPSSSEIPIWNQLFSLSYNFNIKSIPRGLFEAYLDLEEASERIYKSFWDSQNHDDLEAQVNEYSEQIKENEQMLCDDANHTQDLDVFNSIKLLVSNEYEYLNKILCYFEQVKYIMNEGKIINTEHLYWIVGYYKILIGNYLENHSENSLNSLKRLFNSTEEIKKEFESLIAFLTIEDNKGEPFPLQVKTIRKTKIQLISHYLDHPSIIKALLKTFLLTHYIFSKTQIESLYTEFKKFLKTDKRFNIMNESLSNAKFEKYLLELIPHHLAYNQASGFYYSKMLREFLYFACNYYRNEQKRLLFKDFSSIFNLTLPQVEIFIYILLQNGNLFKPNNSEFGVLRCFFLNTYNKEHLIKDSRNSLLSYEDVFIQERQLHNYFFIDNGKKNKFLTQPLFWVFSQFDINTVIKSFYASPIGKSLRDDRPLTIMIKGQSFTTFLDSGSFISIMPRKLADEFFPEKRRKKITFSGVSNISKQGDFISNVEFCVNDQPYTDNFLLKNNMKETFKTDIVLGLDAINKILTRNYGLTFYPLFEKIKQENDLRISPSKHLSNEMKNIDKKSNSNCEGKYLEHNVTRINTIFTVEDSIEMIKECYKILDSGKYNLKDIESNKDNTLSDLIKQYGYSFTESRNGTIMKYFQVISHIISHDRLLPKRHLAKKFGLSRKVLRRITTVLESCGLFLDDKFSISTTFLANDLDSIMEVCYNLFCNGLKSISRFESNENLIKEIVTDTFKYKYNETRRELVIKCYKFVYFLLNKDRNTLYKKDLIERSGLSEPIVYRFLEYLEKNLKIDFSNRFYVPLQHKLNKFLDSKLNDIKNLRYIPTLDRVIEDSGYKGITSDQIGVWFKARFTEGKLSYEYLTDLKNDAGLIKSVPVYEFLDEKLDEIRSHNFIPTVENIKQERPDLNFDILSSLVNSWLHQNNLPLISELQQKAGLASYKKKLRDLLSSLKHQIENYTFIPTPENIMNLTDEFNDFQWLSVYISRWLNKNNIASNLTEYLYNNGIMSDTRRLEDFFDSRLPDIRDGEYFPTIKNLRKDKDIIGLDIDKITILNTVRAHWFNDRLGVSMTLLIEDLDPSYEDLGYEAQWHGYPAQFKNRKLRIFNAEFQIFTLLNEDKLVIFNISKEFKTLKSLFKYLTNHRQWKFVDILTGEVFSLEDFNNGDIILHHIDFEKDNLDPDNLVYLFRDTHGFINAADRYNKTLLKFFSDILTENIQTIKQGIIPDSWKVGLRTLAIQQGVNIPSNRYIKSVKRDTIVKKSPTYIKLDNF